MRSYDHTNECGTWHVREYDLPEFLAAGLNEPPSEANDDHPVAKRNRTGERWDADWMGGTFDEARNLRSWPEGVAKLATINLDGCPLPPAKSRKRVRRWADDGDEFSKDRLDAGYADCWETRKREVRDATSGVVRITVEISANCQRKPDELIWTGIAAAKLADILEDAGYRTEIIVTESTFSAEATHVRASFNLVNLIHVKAASDPLNLDALVLAAAHPLFFRFYGFASILREPVAIRPGLGTAFGTPEALQGAIHIAKVFTKGDAERVVRQEIERRNQP